jgi:hypothetical protein
MAPTAWPGASRRAAARRRRTTTAGLVTLVLAAVLTACSAVPQAVLNVPFSYTADMCQYPLQGGTSMDGGTGCLPSASVAVCLDQASALHVSTSADTIRLVWNGTTYPGPSAVVRDFTTPVLQPGCGQVQFAYLFHLRHYATVTVEKA